MSTELQEKKHELEGIVTDYKYGFKTEYKNLKPLPVEPKSKHITVDSLNEVAKYIKKNKNINSGIIRVKIL